MAFIELDDWLLTAFVAVLLVVSLTLQGVPTERAPPSDTAVCEKPGFATLNFVLSLH
jgi:hypothetical protein